MVSALNRAGEGGGRDFSSGYHIRANRLSRLPRHGGALEPRKHVVKKEIGGPNKGLVVVKY